VPEQLTATRTRAVRAARLAAALALVAFAAGLGVAAGLAVAAVPAHATVRQGPAGPAPISPLGHPRLCWEAWGNGSPVTLEACERTLQGQQWTFTGNVLMNGNGYCLQNGGRRLAGKQPGGQLYLSFSGQCGGARSQLWTFTGQASQVRNGQAGLCAYARGGLVPGAVIVGRPCGTGPRWDAWSQGSSAVRLSAAQHRAAPATRAAQAGAHRVFTGQVALSNAARAMTAYGVSVSVRAPRGLRVTRLTTSASLTGWTCAARTCRGNLAGDGRGEITVAGSVTGRPVADTVTVRATVTRTNQARHGGLSARVPVRVYTAAAGQAGPAAQGNRHGPGSNRAVVVAVIAAGLLLIVGIALAVMTRRRSGPAGPAAPPAAYPDGSIRAAGQQAGEQAGEAAAGRQAR
jgi:hypothetical protein